MLGTLSDRGPDFAGFAVYGNVTPNHSKLTLRAAADFDFGGLLSRLGSMVLVHQRRGSHLVVTVPEASRGAVVAEIERTGGIRIVGGGSRMEIFKEVGRPDQVAARFNLDRMSGTHAIGHTRMATESAVTTEGAHPFTTGPDQCLVHNGSLSNHNAVRRELTRHGLRFETDNDSEVAAGFLTWQMQSGASLQQAMEAALDALDGFYTFVVGTEIGLWRAARPDRLQARGDGGDRSLCRLRHGISRVGRSSRNRSGESVGA